jgi:hypothetical protein
MAIAHILGRLAHFNSARDKSGEGWRVSGGQRDSQRPRISIGRVLGRALLRCIGILAMSRKRVRAGGPAG